MIYNKPIFFEKNRVFRVYIGGKLLGEFVGDNSIDDFYPEEWIASAVQAQERPDGVYKEGISKIENEDIYLDELINKYPSEILGDKKELPILVKYLDSAIRLPIQAHPDKAFSRKYFNSEHGKEESWIVLAKRPGGCVYFGFKEGVTREEFEKAIDESLNDKSVMEKFLVKYDIEVGDVIFVPARTVHAIGEGCLILEIQEPTDFTIQPEYWCGDYKLNHKEMYIDLDKETALDCFDFNPTYDVKLTPETISETDGLKIYSLIGEKITDNFAVNKIIINNDEFTMKQSAGIYIVIDGNGVIKGYNYERNVKKGDYFLLPHNAVSKYKISGNLTVVECY